MWSNAAFYSILLLAAFLAGVLAWPVALHLNARAVCWWIRRRASREQADWIRRRQQSADYKWKYSYITSAGETLTNSDEPKPELLR